jgi:uncharacterized membrane protein YphA (DoxX/SURF4 family)
MSDFPRGSLGLGLALLRVIASGLLVTAALQNLRLGDASVLSVSAIVLAIFLTVGLFTVLAASMGAVLTTTLFLLLHHETLGASIVIVLVCITVALLGGGAYSIDARVFGPRRVIWPDP